MRAVGRLPNVAILGAQATAASWIRRVLASRPDVLAATGDATGSWQHGMPDLFEYRARFADWTSQAVCLDFVGGALLHRAHPGVIAARLRGALPDLRLVVLLRDPLRRASQSLAHHIGTGRVPNTPLLDYLQRFDHGLDPLEIVTAGCYARVLAPYQRSFGDRVLVVLEEELVAEPRATWSRLASFIGCDPTPPRALDHVDDDPAPWDLAVDHDLQAATTRGRLLYGRANDELEAVLGRPLHPLWPTATGPSR